MDSTRRDFVQQVSAGVVGLSGVAGLTASVPADLRAAAADQAGQWNVTWPSRIRGRHKACFDCTETESGYGVWRTGVWARQYMDNLKVAQDTLAPVLILRHNAIILAMQQRFWEAYGIGKQHNVTHPLTGQPTDKNPALLDEQDGLPEPFNQFSLTKQIGRGVITLACNLALQDVIDMVSRTDRITDDAARKIAVDAMVPGVILQPSGVFAAVLAQESDCVYVKAS